MFSNVPQFFARVSRITRFFTRFAELTWFFNTVRLLLLFGSTFPQKLDLPLFDLVFSEHFHNFLLNGFLCRSLHEV